MVVKGCLSKSERNKDVSSYLIPKEMCGRGQRELKLSRKRREGCTYRTVEFTRRSFFRISQRLSSTKPVINNSVMIRMLVPVAPLCNNQRRQDLPVSSGRPESSASSLPPVIYWRVVYDITHDIMKISPVTNWVAHCRYFTRFATQCSFNVKAFRLMNEFLSVEQ